MNLRFLKVESLQKYPENLNVPAGTKKRIIKSALVKVPGQFWSSRAASAMH